jgi:hypothetical protein
MGDRIMYRGWFKDRSGSWYSDMPIPEASETDYSHWRKLLSETSIQGGLSYTFGSTKCDNGSGGPCQFRFTYRHYHLASGLTVIAFLRYAIGIDQRNPPLNWRERMRAVDHWNRYPPKLGAYYRPNGRRFKRSPKRKEELVEAPAHTTT